MKLIFNLFISAMSLFGQQTYLLTGKGYISGMSYTSSITGTFQIESSDSSTPEADSYQLIHKVDVQQADEKTGKITEAFVEISGDYENMQDDDSVPSEYLNKKLLFKRKWNGWDVYLDDNQITGKSLEALNSVPFCEESNTLPTSPVPIGYKWLVSLSEALRMMGQTKELSDLVHNVSGQSKYVFQNIVTIDGNDCAQINMSANMKLIIPNQGTMTIKGNINEFRRLDLGILSHAEGKFEMKGSGTKAIMTTQLINKIKIP